MFETDVFCIYDREEKNYREGDRMSKGTGMDREEEEGMRRKNGERSQWGVKAM